MIKKQYLNTNTYEQTTKPTLALQWHRRGDGVRVNIENENDFNEKEFFIKGAHIETYQEKTDRKNREHCKRIAKDLEDYCDGLVRKCPNCGELVEIDELTTGDKYRCPSCENTEYVEEYEYQNLYDYFEDALDIEYRVGSDKQLRSVCIMVTCGGPNIYIDTATKQVELYWWGDRASYPINYDVCDEIDNYFEEIFNY